MHQVREQGLSRTPGEPGSSARDPSEAGEPKGEPWHRGLTLQPPAQLFAHHQRAPARVPVLPLLTHFADISTFMVQQVIGFTRGLPLCRRVTSPWLPGRRHCS